jgi:hypothetical protein
LLGRYLRYTNSRLSYRFRALSRFLLERPSDHSHAALGLVLHRERLRFIVSRITDSSHRLRRSAFFSHKGVSFFSSGRPVGRIHPQRPTSVHRGLRRLVDSECEVCCAQPRAALTATFYAFVAVAGHEPHPLQTPVEEAQQQRSVGSTLLPPAPPRPIPI